MIAEGKHRGRGVTAAMGKTEKGHPQVAVEFEFLDLPGTRLTWFGNFSETTVGEDQKPLYQITLESLYHCGWISGDLQDLAGIDQNEVTLVVKHDEYQGKTRAKIAWVNKAGSGVAMKNAMPSNELSAFAARMKGASMATRKSLNIPPAETMKAKPRPATPPAGAGDAWEPEDKPPEWLND
jgi:hypothetical protein